MNLGVVVRRIGDNQARTKMLSAVVLLVVLLLTWTWGQNVIAAEVTAVRLGNHSDHTRFVVDLSANLSFAVFPLIRPDRIVIDFGVVNWKLPQLSGAGTGVVFGYRYDNAATQIVLELAKPAAILNALILPPDQMHGWRLVIDLAETTREVFLNSLGLRQGSAPNSSKAHLLDSNESLTRRSTSAVYASSVLIHPSFPPLVTRRTLPSLPARAEIALGFGLEKVPAPSLPRPEELSSFGVSPSPAPVQAEHQPMIMLDPGHGGVDPGATSVSSIFEKHITLAMATELREKLLATGRYRVALTRKNDIFIALRDRVASARAYNADLFISLHADAIATPAIRGLSVYTLSKEASDQEAAALADQENKADLIGGVDLSNESRDVANILIDLVQRETMNYSARLASTFIRELQREVQLLPKTHRFAGFAVLKAPDVPAVLLEMGYLSNPEEEQLLRQPAYRAKLNSALVRAVDYYFKGRKVAQP